MLVSLWHDMANLLYPQLCSGCDTPLMKQETHLCLHCYAELPYTKFEEIRDNPVEHIFTGRVDIAWATSLFYFSKETCVQQIVHQIKYKGNKMLANEMGNMMGQALKMAGLTADIIVPVPLHRQKEQQRGYNQSMLLSEGISAASGITLNNQLLYRKMVTATQTRKSRVERWENVGEAFEAKGNENLHGKHLLLVDDVITTGSTLEACASALLRADCASVSIATLGFATHW